MTAPRALLLVLLVTAIVAVAAGLPLTRWLADGAAWAGHHPLGAGALFVAAYTVAAVLAVPGTLLTLGAGFTFGLVLGVALVSAGSVLGAIAAFLLGRFVARGWVARRIADSPRWRALDSATRHDAFTLVLLARLSPLLPYNMLNYAFGLTDVRLRDYALGSWIGMLPATVLYVYIGSLAKNVPALTSGHLDASWATRALLVGGLIATVGLTLLIAQRATRALRHRLEANDSAAREHAAQ
jgi:uncharacterized membrane protein YdjX (TVP38/TMEM64 family)